MFIVPRRRDALSAPRLASRTRSETGDICATNPTNHERDSFFVNLLGIASAQSLPDLFPFPNGSGVLATHNAGGRPIDLTGPFFQSLGTNGRSCGSCHRPAQGWSISPPELKLRFDLTFGTDPIFRPVDGSNCDHDIDTSTVGARRKAYSLLLDKGLIRVALAVPADAEFEVVSVANPYGCSSTSLLSMYRRPWPSQGLNPLWAAWAIPMTMYSPRQSMAFTKPN